MHRAYHALPPLTSRGGELVNAVYGFSTMLLKIIDDLKPTHMAVAFDTEKPTFRHAEYVGYQAQRPKMESELSSQIKIVQEVVRAFGIPIFSTAGYEADDLIGTITKKAKKKMEIIVVSGDKDLLQLVDFRVRVYAPIKGLSESRMFDQKEVKKELGVTPAQVVEYKGLVGDPSDNYPGVPGVGPKTAQQLLAEFGTVKKIYQGIKSKKGKAKSMNPKLLAKLAEGHESAVLSRRLAQIATDAPLKVSLAKMKFRKDGGGEKLIEKFEELGFKSLVARLKGKTEKKGSRAKTESKKKKKGGQLELV